MTTRDRDSSPPTASPASADSDRAVRLLAETIETFPDIEDAQIDALLDRIGDSRVVLLGEATHGTSEFYRMRAKITRALIERNGFGIVAAEADWPDAARIDDYVRGRESRPADWQAFARFPTWMWRNHEFREFVDWLYEYNADRPPEERAAFYGLDLYSLYRSIEAVLSYLDETDREVAGLARQRYGCLDPWEADATRYGKETLTGAYENCEDEVLGILNQLIERRLEYAAADPGSFLDAIQNARLVANAERYYRTMYYGAREAWNLRDNHMFETLQHLLEHHGSDSRAVVWAHNSHLGDAAATEMGDRGEHNVGQLAREEFGDEAFLVGFGTDHGTVAAASGWDGPMKVKNLRPSRPDSYERLFHDAKVEAGMLHLREPDRREVRSLLEPSRLERAIGVIYRPETERGSHYFVASLARQFDEYIWFDRTRALHPLAATELAGMPETYPFGV